MVDSDYNEEELVKSMQRVFNAERVTKYFKEPLQSVIDPLLDGNGLDSSDFIDIILLTIFTNFDLFGYLYKGRNSSSNAVSFIRDYLGKVDERYRMIGGLLYHALRHGLVHLATPKRIELKDGKMLDFSFTLGPTHREYLSIEKVPETPGNIDIHRLLIDLSQLYKDLIAAIDLYLEDIKHIQVLSEVFEKAGGIKTIEKYSDRLPVDEKLGGW